MWTHLNPQKALNSYDISQLAPHIQAVDMVINTKRTIDKLVANRPDGIISN
jgi:hypothetical protein